jgi:hypothetical protein
MNNAVKNVNNIPKTIIFPILSRKFPKDKHIIRIRGPSKMANEGGDLNYGYALV